MNKVPRLAAFIRHALCGDVAEAVVIDPLAGPDASEQSLFGTPCASQAVQPCLTLSSLGAVVGIMDFIEQQFPTATIARTVGKRERCVTSIRTRNSGCTVKVVVLEAGQI